MQLENREKQFFCISQLFLTILRLLVSQSFSKCCLNSKGALAKVLVSFGLIFFSLSSSAQNTVAVNVSDDLGAPLSGLNVYAFDQDTYTGNSASTDASGFASFSLVDGDYRFRIDVSGTQYFSSNSNHCTLPGCTTINVEIPQPIQISVTSSNGSPEAGLNVYAFDGVTYTGKSAVTDSAGNASLQLLSGDYRFRIDKNGTQFFTGENNHCAVPGCTSASLEIPEPVTVTVTSSSGGFEDGLNVYAFDGTSYIGKSAVTDLNGEAVFSLVPGTYRFRIDKNGTQFFTDVNNHCSVPGCVAVAYEVPESVVVTVTTGGVADSGLNVYAFDGSSYSGKSAVTDVNGEAELTLVPGSYRFRIDKNGTQFFTDANNHCSIPGCISAALDIPGQIVVNVTSSSGGVESGLNVYAFDGTTYTGTSAVTDSLGVATFTLPAGDYRFRIDKNGTQFFTGENNHCSAPGCVSIDYEIPENIAVSVTSSAGGIEAGLNVYAFEGTTYSGKSAVTDSNGEAVFTLEPGDYRFRIDKNGTQFFTQETNHCTAPGCTAVSFEIPEDITVTVTSSSGGFESGLNVYAFEGTTYAGESAVTDVNGEAVFSLPSGDYRFRIDKNGTQFFTDDLNHCTAPGCTAIVYEIPEDIVVTVTNSAGGFESGLNVYAFDDSVYSGISALTDESGEAIFTLLPGNYRFRVDKNGTQLFTDDVNHCSAPGCTAATLEIPEVITVTVTSSAGGFESGLNVFAFNNSTYTGQSAVTDVNGEASFTLPAGDYRFRVDKNGTQFFTGDVNHCTAPGCTAATLEIPENIVVTVTSSAGGFEPGLNVYAFDETTYTGESAITDAHGQATFTLPTGSYRFRIDKNGTQYFTSDTNHCVAPGCTTATLEIPENVVVTVTSSAGGFESGLNVFAFDETTYSGISAVTDANGEAVFSLPAGDYRFRIDKNGTQFFTDEANHCSAPGCAVVSYEIPESVVVNVTNSAGGFETGLNVYAFDESVYSGKSAVTDENGDATFTLLPGNYRFRTDKAGSQFFSNATNHCAVPGCILIAQVVPASLSSFVVDPALGACLDAAGFANSWTSVTEVTSLSCDNAGVTNLAGIENFTNLTSLSLTNNAITLLGNLNGLSNLASLDLSGNASLECNQLGDLNAVVGAGIVTQPATCLAEGELVFSVSNPGKPDTNQFSFDVSLTPAGDIISSAITYNPGTDSFDGRVYLIDRTNGQELFEFDNPAPSGSDYFGWSVAALPDGDVIVGAWQDDVGGAAAGVVYVFDGNNGELVVTIENPSPDNDDRFGYSVASTNNGSILVGAYRESGGGAVYVFDAAGNLDQSIMNPTGDSDADFGRSVAALSNGEIIAGAPQQDVISDSVNYSNAGSVRVYPESGGAPILVIDNPEPAANDDFGSEVASASNDDIVVSARFTNNFADNDGRVSVFDGSDGAHLWTVVNPLADDNGLFGTALSSTPQGNIVVGSANDDSGATNSGRVYVFEEIAGGLIKIIDNPTPSANSNFGEGLEVTPEGQIAIGAFGADAGYGELHLFTSVRNGDDLNLINQQQFGDDSERECVLAIAAENGWATLEEANGFDFGCESSGVGEPDPFNFTDLGDAIIGALVTSDTITLSGFTGTLTAEIAIHTHAKNPELSVNGGPFTSLPQNVVEGDTLQARFVTPSDGNFSALATITVGAVENGGLGVYDDWIVTTGNMVLGDLGFEGPYEVFGNPSNDDLFIKRDNSDGQIPGVSPFYLERSFGGGHFYNLVPNVTEAQAVADGFDLSSPLELSLNDGEVSGDGIRDVIIEGLNEIGGQNVIIYGGTSLNSPPAAFVEIDAEFRNFYDDMASYLFNLNNWTEITGDERIDDPDVLSFISLVSSYVLDDDGVRIPLPISVGDQVTDLFNSVIFDQVTQGAEIQWFDGILRTYDRDFGSLPDYPGGISGGDLVSLGDVWDQLVEGVASTSLEKFGVNDMDDDGISNEFDAFPLDKRESSDFDGDGIGDNADKDDDNDRMPDSFEELHRFDPQDRLDADLDSDNDGTTNLEEFFAGTFPGSGTAEALNEQSLQLFSPGNNKLTVTSQRSAAIMAPKFYLKDVQFAQSPLSISNQARTFDSELGITYEFVSDELTEGTARFFIEENGQLPSGPFLTKTFTGGTVSLDSRTDFDPPIEDILTEINMGKPLVDIPVVVQFFDTNEVLEDELTLLVSVVRMLEVEFRNPATGELQSEFAYNEDVTARFILNGINQAALNVTRFDVEVSYRADANSEPMEWPLVTLFPNELQQLEDTSEIEIPNSKAYELTEQVQQVGEYTFIATAIVEDFQGEVPTESAISTSAQSLNITEAVSGNATTDGFDEYLAFGLGGPQDDIYIAKLGPGNTIVGDLEVLLEPRGSGYILTANPSVTISNFDPQSFVNAGQILTNELQVGDINADGLVDIAISDLPNSEFGAFIFAGETNADIVYRQLNAGVIDFFRLVATSLEFRESRLDFINEFINNSEVTFVNYFGDEVNNLPRPEKDATIVEIYGPESFPPGTPLNFDTCRDIVRGYTRQFFGSVVECYTPDLHISTTNPSNIVAEHFAGYNVRFTDLLIRPSTPDEDIVTKVVLVEFAGVDIARPDLRVVPFIQDASDLANTFDLLRDGYFSDFIGSIVAENLRDFLTQILGKAVFGGPIQSPQDLPIWDSIPGDVNGNDTQIILSQIFDIISAVYAQANDEEINAPGSPENPHPLGSIVVNGSAGVFSNGSVGSIELLCGEPSVLDTELDSCSVNSDVVWDFLGDGQEVSGSSFESFLYDQPGIYNAQCRLEVTCGTNPSVWYARNTEMDVRDPVQFGTPNRSGEEIFLRNMTAGDPSSFYGSEYDKSIVIENSEQFVDLTSFIADADGALEQIIDDIEFVVNEYASNGGLMTSIGRLESPEMTVQSFIGDFEVDTYRIDVKYKDREFIEDSVILVVLGDGAYTDHADESNSSSWVSEEQDFLDNTSNWHSLLPVLYQSLVVVNDSPQDPEFDAASGGQCDPDNWKEPGAFSILGTGSFHPGAAFEMRSEETTGGHGHQATYDASGNIITDPMLGSGSADRAAPGVSFAHRDLDVLPFIRAAQLDGNPVQAGSNVIPTSMRGVIQHFGPNLTRYFELRPAIVEGSGFLSSGLCSPE